MTTAGERVVGVAVWAALLTAGCGPSEPAGFEIGSADDPVVRMASALSSSLAMSTITVTLKNTSNRDYTQGLLTLAPLFAVGQTASSAVTGFVSDQSSKAGQNSALVTAAGLTLNVNAFKIGDLGKGKSRTITLQVPVGAQLYYIARVDSTRTDFVGAANVERSSAILNYTIVGGIVVASGTQAGTSTAVDSSACSGASAMNNVTQLLDDEMALAANDRNWPVTAGYDGEFNGDWYSDGVSARVWTQDGAALGRVTGFVKFVSICPVTGSTISLEADVDTALYSAAASDTTLHIYYFDAANNVLKVDHNFTLRKGTLGRIGLYDSAVPAAARRIAIVPMARFDAAEQSSVFYHSLRAEYEPPGTVALKPIGSDDFSTYDVGTKQPKGWAEYNGDWYVMPADGFATVWNSAWGGSQAVVRPYNTGLTKTFSLTGLQAGDALDASLFAALTFSDPSSFAMLRLTFDSGAIVDSTRLGGQTYQQLDIRRTLIPSGAAAVTVSIIVNFGTNETSSLYVDNLKLNLVR